MIIKNALLSIKKNWGRTLLLFAIIFLIINLVMAGFSIKSATNKAMVNARKALGSEVTLSYNMQSLIKNRTKGESLDSVMKSIKVSDADKLKNLKYVSSYNYIQTVNLTGSSIKEVSTSTQTNMPGNRKESSSLTVSGQLNMSSLSVFKNKNYVLSSGTLINKAGTNQAVISSELASDNNLKVGSTFTVKTSKKTTTLKVVGIYKVKSMGNQMMGPRSNPYNTIYTTLATAQSLNGSTTTLSSAIYTLDDPAHIEAFEALAKKTSIDWNTFALETNNITYEQSVSSLNSMNQFASIFLTIVIVVGAIILALILILALKSRYYEFGILLSMGQAKIKIILQQLLEIGIIAVIAFMLSLSTGKLVSNSLSNILFTSNNQTQQIERNEMKNAFKAPMNQALDVSLNTSTITKLAATTSLLCVVSIIIPSIAVLKMSPRKILMKKEN